jgi:hypothetical protein
MPSRLRCLPEGRSRGSLEEINNNPSALPAPCGKCHVTQQIERGLTPTLSQALTPTLSQRERGKPAVLEAA